MEYIREQRILKALGARIATVRKSRGFTQAQLAEMMGISIVGLAYIESGKRSPRVATLANIAGCLKVEITDLFKGV